MGNLIRAADLVFLSAMQIHPTDSTRGYDAVAAHFPTRTSRPST
ncbi:MULTISPECIES: hypothetical protein [Gordonia]|nr:MULTISPECIES: hypothetical protein [Gordonia]WLP89477.1 hypothetical protein Q9K23_18100 [Gordonia sp. NB41Y]